MGRHHFLTRLARYFHVVWVNPAPEWREVIRPADSQGTFKGAPPSPPGFSVYKPRPWMLRLYRPSWLAKYLFDKPYRHARELLRQRGCRFIVLSVWHPRFEAVIGSVDCDLSCYHIMDEYSFSEVERPTDEVEKRIISQAGQVFVLSPGLLEKKGGINPHTDLVPDGVEFDLFSSPQPEPADLAEINRPRIGYTGRLKKQLDWGLIRSLAAQHPDWSFVFVGPLKTHREAVRVVEDLSRRANVHFLGMKSVRDVPAYTQHFDVCIMPYKVNDYTNYIYPLKLHEYLATGRPVVGSPIRSLQEHAEILNLPPTPEDWTTAIERALSADENAPDRRAARQAIASQHDWKVLIDRMAGIILRRLGQNSGVDFGESLAALARAGDGRGRPLGSPST